MELEKLIERVSEETLTQYFRERTELSNFKPIQEEFDNLIDKEVKFNKLLKLGEAELDNDKQEELLIFCCQYKGQLSERSAKKKQYEIAKKVLKEDFKDGAIFVFYDETGNFRLSFIRQQYDEKKQKFSTWKRYTYFVEQDRQNKTFKNRINACSFRSLDEIQEAFSVEPLNKEFYQDIVKYFFELISGKYKTGSKTITVEKPLLQLPSTPYAGNQTLYKEFAVRLIGRTIFCWFLKNKKSSSGVPLIPDSWLSSSSITEPQNGYYHLILEKLFFLVLNKKIEDREGLDLPDFSDTVPFLNGGLFEPLPGDFFHKNKANYALVIPDSWFKDLFSTLEQYNFTIDENSNNDTEVSIDPEMLGTIFENLLAEIDPDTEKSARKATGSFYTPREIVDYMVEQSIVQYLKTKTKLTDEESLLQLLQETQSINETPEFTSIEKEQLLSALSAVKILDPACGSGAFPMGALNKICLALEKLDPNAEWWKNQQIKLIPNAIAKKSLKEKLDKSTSDYARKLGVIQNSIYGVDIQPIATEISKLRSFLSLVIDENIDDNDYNRGIEPLPNLEFKFVTANTLIGLDENKSGKTGNIGSGYFDFGETEQLQNELQELRNNYLQASPVEKEKIKTQFEILQTQIYKQELRNNSKNKRAQQLASWKPFSNESCKWFDPQWMYGVKDFDIVIGNPPYSVFQGKSKKQLSSIMENEIYDKAKGGKINAYELFLCKTPKLLKENGVNSQIFQNSFLADNTTAGVRKFYIENQKIISIDSFPERDNPKKRIFEKVKMSVCILINLNTYSKSHYFQVNFWKDKYKSSGKSIIYNNEAIFKFNPDQAIIYNLDNHEKNIFEKYFLNNKINYSNHYKCMEGELNMTFHKNYLVNDNKKPLVIKGAQVQRYFVTDNPSQGEVQYLDKRRYLNDYKRSKKSKHHRLPRVAMQGITGANDKIRIISTLINKDVFLANSCNYIISISKDQAYSIGFILGVFNSKFTNWIFRRSSTNSNVNCYEVDNLKLPEYNKQFYQKINKLAIECSETADEKVENQIDILVYKLYNLTYDEVLIVDPEFSLSKEEYENYKIEE